MRLIPPMHTSSCPMIMAHFEWSFVFLMDWPVPPHTRPTAQSKTPFTSLAAASTHPYRSTQSSQCSWCCTGALACRSWEVGPHLTTQYDCQRRTAEDTHGPHQRTVLPRFRPNISLECWADQVAVNILALPTEEHTDSRQVKGIDSNSAAGTARTHAAFLAKYVNMLPPVDCRRVTLDAAGNHASPLLHTAFSSGSLETTVGDKLTS
jgi:hypothetical protein